MWGKLKNIQHLRNQHKSNQNLKQKLFTFKIKND